MPVNDLHFTSEQEPQLENYRALSGMAVAAFILGLLAPTALAMRHLLFIPVLGTVLGIVAIVRIANSDNALSGRRLAMIGLAFSLYFGVWAASQDLSRQWLLAREARHCCDGWLQLLQEDRTAEAFRWSLPPGERIVTRQPLVEYYRRDTEAGRAAERYLDGLPFPTNLEGSSLQSFRFLGNSSVVAAETGEQLVTHRYEVSYLNKDGEQRVDEILITATRHPPDDDGAVHWHINEIKRPSPVR
jgi:hypothetical protein